MSMRLGSYLLRLQKCKRNSFSCTKCTNRRSLYFVAVAVAVAVGSYSDSYSYSISYKISETYCKVTSFAILCFVVTTGMRKFSCKVKICVTILFIV